MPKLNLERVNILDELDFLFSKLCMHLEKGGKSLGVILLKRRDEQKYYQ